MHGLRIRERSMDIERRKYRETAEGETEHWTEKQTDSKDSDRVRV